MPDGRPVEAATLANEQGMPATIISYGAALQSFLLPDNKIIYKFRSGAPLQ